MSSSAPSSSFFIDDPSARVQHPHNPHRPSAAFHAAAPSSSSSTATPLRGQGGTSSARLAAASARRSGRAAVGGGYDDGPDDGGIQASKVSAASAAGALAGPSSARIDDDDNDLTEVVQRFYEGLRRDETHVVRECWFVAQGIDTERFQFAFMSANSASAEGGDPKCHDCHRHLRVTDGRTRSSALHLLDHQMFPLFCGPDGNHSQSHDRASSSRETTYWSLLGSGARDAIQIVGQAGAAWRDVEACQAHLLGPDNMTDSFSSSGICRALASALERELQSIRIKMAYNPAESESHQPDSARTLRQFLVSLLPLQSRLVALQNLCNSWRQHLNFTHHGTATTSTTVRSGGDSDDVNDADPSVSIQLLNLISAQAMSGDTRTVDLCRSLWTSAVEPWYQMLFGWITRGIVPSNGREVADLVRHPSNSAPRWSGGHFFVEVAADDDDASISPKGMWRHKFRLNAANVPSNTLSRQQVRAAFLIGKGINYLQTCLGECLVVDDEVTNEQAPMDSQTADTDSGSAFSSDPTSYFARLIRSASAKVHSRILQALHDDHSLLHHLLALKQFLLLGQGDFVSSFMAGLLDEFGSGNVAAGRNNNHQYRMPGMHRHALSEILDASLRGSNAMHFPNDILRRLRVQLTGPDGTIDGEDGDFSLSFERSSAASHDKSQASPAESVWGRVAFSYVLPDPFVAIVPPAGMRLYTQLSQFLLSVRRIDMLLNLTWRQSSCLQQEIQTCAQRCAIHVSEHETYAQANILLRQLAMTRQAMMHFSTNLSSYLMYEVLETEWKRLVRATESASTLDELIAAHEEYLACVHRKSLLSSVADDGDDLGGQIRELLRLSNAFCAYQEHVFGEALRAVQRAADKRKRAEAQQTSGEWGFKGEIEEEESFFGLADPSKLQDLEQLSSVFNDKIMHLLRSLDLRLNGGRMRAIDEESTVAGFGHTTHTIDEDLDSLRFLEFQLNNNGYYNNALNASGG
jgi:Gamma tubulin complex component C-terminal/Gamma tubulin complex component N-terminal